MSGGNRRSQSKIVRELPPELVETINNMLVREGLTYQQVTDYLKEQGHNISRSSVGRYGKNFADRMERLRVIREQAKTIVESVGQLQFSNDTQNQIAEFTVNFKCVQPNIY